MFPLNDGITHPLLVGGDLEADRLGVRNSTGLAFQDKVFPKV